MTDGKIPEKCRTCANCQRYHDIEPLMYDWVPWDYRCLKGRWLDYKDECSEHEKAAKR